MASPLRLRGSLAKGPLGTLGAPKGILLDTRQLMVTSSTNDRVNIEQSASGRWNGRALQHLSEKQSVERAKRKRVALAAPGLPDWVTKWTSQKINKDLRTFSRLPNSVKFLKFLNFIRFFQFWSQRVQSWVEKNQYSVLFSATWHSEFSATFSFCPTLEKCKRKLPSHHLCLKCCETSVVVLQWFHRDHHEALLNMHRSNSAHICFIIFIMNIKKTTTQQQQQQR